MTRSVLGKLQLTEIPLKFKTSCCNLKIKVLAAKLFVLFYYFNFERTYYLLKSKSPCILLNKYINCNKNKTESKSQHTLLERGTLCFSSYKNHKLRVQLWCVGARERKKSAFFVLLILSEGDFFNICILCQCLVYWIHFQNKHTFAYQKHYFKHFFAWF